MPPLSLVLAGAQDGGFMTRIIKLDQVNLLLPRSLAGRGEVDVALSIDGQTANLVKVSFR